MYRKSNIKRDKERQIERDIWRYIYRQKQRQKEINRERESGELYRYIDRYRDSQRERAGSYKKIYRDSQVDKTLEWNRCRAMRKQKLGRIKCITMQREINVHCVYLGIIGCERETDGQTSLQIVKVIE